MPIEQSEGGQVAPWQQRVIDEKKELDDRHQKLTTFIFGNRQFHQLPEAEQERLKRQWRIMDEYSGVLAERIEAWNDIPHPE